MKTVFWDFDGVILDSMKVRDYGFEKIFEKFSPEKVQKLIQYHRENGGLSRYVKIKYFFNEILGQDISESMVNQYANAFSLIMRRELTNPDNLIDETVKFIKNNYTKFNFHIVSGSDQDELRFLCEELNLSHFFLSIHGSPTPKTQLVGDIMRQKEYNLSTSCLIGDSKNDYDAAQSNGIAFYGYNNEKIKDLGVLYIQTFEEFTLS
ncbi:MAG: HAD family hydrolase [Mangrovimonas sp.]|nr:HAD family hydrolase [Mangrovimonas sp.]HRV55161.1 HAD hydrolase-like protein [Mangrovimonas sp.]